MQPAAASKPLTIILFAVEGEVETGSFVGIVAPDGSTKQGAAVQVSVETTEEEVSACPSAEDLVNRLLLPGCYAFANHFKEARAGKRSFTLHEERDLTLGFLSYRVGGLPDGKTARIANFGDSLKNDWRIARIEHAQKTDWTGHYESVEDALAAI